MADDKKNIPDVASPTEAPAPTVEKAAVPEPPAPDPVLTDAEAVMLEQEGHAALFEMGEAVPDPADAVTHAEVEKPAAPEVPKAEKEQAQPPDPGKDDPAPAHSGKVVDFAVARDEVDYILVGDYYIPDLKLPEEHRPIGKYGRMHREYLREVHPARLNTLILTGELWTYLANLNEQAQERIDTIIEQMKTAEGVTEELKCTRQMEWVRRCNNIHNRAEEIVLHEIIYS